MISISLDEIEDPCDLYNYISENCPDNLDLPPPGLNRHGFLLTHGEGDGDGEGEGDGEGDGDGDGEGDGEGEGDGDGEGEGEIFFEFECGNELISHFT